MALNKKVCLFTGAGGLLGNEFCRRFYAKYAIVAVCGRRKVNDVPDQHHTLVDPLDPAGHKDLNENRLFTIHADLAQPGQIDRVVELALARYGRIDAVVNAAVYSVWSSMLESDEVAASAERQFLVNAIAPFRLSLAIARAFWRNRDAENRKMNRCVVNVSSIGGVKVYQESGQSVYSASKAALNYLTYHMAHEFRPIGVRVAGIAPNSFPGIVPTESVAIAIDRMIDSEANGDLLVIDEEPEGGNP
jgi:NAD(P)-dependent dehydrogenase (short-subunit alcohol dehydrogenase family)